METVIRGIEFHFRATWPSAFLLADEWEHVAALAGVASAKKCVILAAIPIANNSSEPWNGWAVTRRDLQRAERRVRSRGYRIYGIAHTHPGIDFPEPSDADYEGLPQGLIGMLYLPKLKQSMIYGNCGEG